jgi:DNA-directed RNA polymerase subunit M/transcription elongation factor TFIIS
MPCPNCEEQMTHHVLDKQNILHCSNCGASFFEDNGINRISLPTAMALAQDVYNKTSHVNAIKNCPKDTSVLIPVANIESVPPDVRLLSCPTCHGVFAEGKQLIVFKEAQEAKVNYLKIWKIPLPSLRPVFVLASIVILFGSLFFGLNAVQKNTLYQSQASDLFKNIKLSYAAHYMFVTFRTEAPYLSEIEFNNVTRGATTTKQISTKPQTAHYAAFNQLDITDLHDEVYYVVRLKDSKGNVVVTTKSQRLTTDFAQ